MTARNKTVLKTENGYGAKCKTYLYDLGGDVYLFEKYSIYKLPMNEKLLLYLGGEHIIRETENYIFTYHYFSIKKTSLEVLLNNIKS